MANDPTPKPPTTVPCPTCGKPVRWHETPTRPFCSERCRIQDQAAWAEERYRLPSEDSPDMDDEFGGNGSGGSGDA